MSRTAKFLLGCHLTVGLLASSSALAEQLGRPSLRLADPSSFQERFSGNTPVSGHMLSGLAYESDKGSLDLNVIGLGYPYQSETETICVRMTTDDGRYWAINLYAGDQPPAGTAPLLTLPTSYSSQLANYRSDGLLLLASRSADCSNLIEHPLIPGLIGGRAPDADLLAYVNVSQGRVTAWLEREANRVTEPAACELPAEGTKVTYSHICSLDIAGGDVSGHYELVVAVRSMTGGGVSQRYGVYID